MLHTLSKTVILYPFKRVCSAIQFKVKNIQIFGKNYKNYEFIMVLGLNLYFKE